MSTQFVMSHQLLGDLFPEYRVKSATDVNRREFLMFALLSALSSARSRASSAFSVSACEWTETYSPTAIDIAPATRPAVPATKPLSVMDLFFLRMHDWTIDPENSDDNLTHVYMFGDRRIFKKRIASCRTYRCALKSTVRTYSRFL